MNDITKKYFYKKFITDILELDENTKYSLLFIYIKFRDFINNNNFVNNDTLNINYLFENNDTFSNINSGLVNIGTYGILSNKNNGIITNKPKVVYDILKDIGKR